MFLLDGKRLQPGVAFTHGNIQYPANWLQLSTLAEKEAIGITEVADGTRPNDEYYWVTDNNDGTYSSTPKLLNDRQEFDNDGNPLYVQVLDPITREMVDSSELLFTKGLKSNWTTQFKTTANTLLAKTDWMVVRKFEREIDIPTDTATYRAAVITETNRLETAIAATTTVEELIAVVTAPNWPQE